MKLQLVPPIGAEQITMRLVCTRLGIALVAFLSIVATGVSAPQVGAVPGTVTEYPNGITPIGIVNGPDNKLYVAEHVIDQITKVAYDGSNPVPPFPSATDGSGPFHIITGFNGELWYTELLSGSIGRMTTGGAVLPSIPTPTPNSAPLDLRIGPDGAIWFTENAGNKIGRISRRACGVVGDYCVGTELTIPTADSAPGDINIGPDGNMWFTETNTGKIGRVNLNVPGYSITEFALPDPNSRPEGIVTGPDGNLWFTLHDTNQIGKMSPTGTLLALYSGMTGAGPTNIIVGPDGALWFPEEFNPGPDPENLPPGDKIGRITTAGVISEYTTPTPGSRPVIVTSGSDGNIWFTEVFNFAVGRIEL